MNPVGRVKDKDCGAGQAQGVARMIRYGWMRSRWLALAVCSGLAASCANGPVVAVPGNPPIALPTPAPDVEPIVYATSGHAAMDAWRTDFTARAVAAGHDRAIVRSLLTGIKPLPIWLGSEVEAQAAPSTQAEFAKPIWEYLRVPLGQTRISTGQAKLASLSPTLAAIEARYGVDRQVLLSIWGMETSYGGFIGRDDAANALANMAVEGRRRAFAEGELTALIKIIANGDAARKDLVSGWAGAMGQTQFMPTTYVGFAEDFDGDGRKDVWKSEADALASAANYLAKSGYMKGQPWGIEVMTPAGFDFRLADGEQRRMETWITAGLVPAAGDGFETGGADFAELWLPAGATGPKYLLFKNFNVFKTYNRADSYAFAIGLAGDAIIGRRGPLASWPTHLAPLTVDEIRSLQAGLAARGFDPGGVDGIAGRRTKMALQAFQASKDMVADGYPTRDLLAIVTSGGSAYGVN